MRAQVLTEHGGQDKVRFKTDFPDPEPGVGEVILRVRATSLNYHDIFTRNGMPGIKIPLPMIMGLDVAGEIVETGKGVTDWKIGDRVLIDPRNMVEGGLVGETIHGGLAEFCRIPTHQLIAIPPQVSFEQAAALPVAYGTAYRMMFARGGVRAGEKVLVLGASGGVGTCCVMLAKMVGASVYACASSEKKIEFLKTIGADHGINYKTHDFMNVAWDLVGKPRRRDADSGFDAVVNFTGGDTWVKSLRCLKPNGRLLTCGATAGFDPKTDIRFIWTFELDIRGSNGWERDDLEALLGLTANGNISPVIDRTLPLEKTNEAFRLVEEREVIGKVVVVP